jgi:hypothetical protein
LPELQEWLFRGTPVERAACFENGSEEKRFAYKTAFKTDKVKVADAATRSRKLSAFCSTIQRQLSKKLLQTRCLLPVFINEDGRQKGVQYCSIARKNCSSDAGRICRIRSH